MGLVDSNLGFLEFRFFITYWSFIRFGNWVLVQNERPKVAGKLVGHQERSRMFDLVRMMDLGLLYEYRVKISNCFGNWLCQNENVNTDFVLIHSLLLTFL